MAKLMNDRKVLEDSLKYYHGSEAMFKDSSKSVAYATHDSTKYLPLVDTESKYWNLARLVDKQIEAINFSIDSLSKMK